VITSPPYYGLRDYGLPPLVWGDWTGSLGLEPTPELFIQHMVEVFRQVRRVLRDDGTVWLNLGSSYFGSGKGPTGHGGIGDQAKRQGFVGGDDTHPNHSRQPERAPAYGSDGTGPADSPEPDSVYSDLCDECRAAILRRGHHNADNTQRSRVYALQLSQIGRDTARRDYDPISPLSSLPDAPESTTLQFSPQRLEDCHHCANCGACLSVLRSTSRDAHACVRRTAGLSGTHLSSDATTDLSGSSRDNEVIDGSLVDHITGTVYDSAYRYSTTVPHQPYKPKDEMLLPFRVALALQADGWTVRSIIPWLKRSAMPESVTDRPATAVEYVFLLSKSARYFWDADAVRQPHMEPWRSTGGAERGGLIGDANGMDRIFDKREYNPNGRNLRNADSFFQTWQGLLLDEQDEPLALVVNPSPYKKAHYATFPTKLVEPMIKASTSEKGCCPECGAPWVRVTKPTEQYAKRLEEAKTWGSWYAHADESEMHEVTVRGKTYMAKHGKPYESSCSPEYVTTGWRPTCQCKTPKPVPQTVLDPFGGSGTVGLVADRLNRNAILCELKPDYSHQANGRIIDDAPLFTTLEMFA
jgi:DNA modification methylase